jgi:hypothetical protein
MCVVSYLNKEGPSWTGCGQLLLDTKIILSSLSHFGFNHVNMEANMAAHCLAKFALLQLLCKVWLEDCPSIIQKIVRVEQAEDS